MSHFQQSIISSIVLISSSSWLSSSVLTYHFFHSTYIFIISFNNLVGLQCHQNVISSALLSSSHIIDISPLRFHHRLHLGFITIFYGYDVSISSECHLFHNTDIFFFIIIIILTFIICHQIIITFIIIIILAVDPELSQTANPVILPVVLQYSLM